MRNKKIFRLFYISTILLLTIFLAGCSSIQGQVDKLVNSSNTQIKVNTPKGQSDNDLLNMKFDIAQYPENYANLGESSISDEQLQQASQKQNGSAWYSLEPMDLLGRSQAGQAFLTSDEVTQTSYMKRPSFGYSVAPSGYKNHNKIVQLDNYRGYLYNKSHTLAWSLIGKLGGDANPANKSMQQDNLTTGTRAQNVGTNGRSGQTAGGMAYGETIVRNYLREQPNRAVLYTVTPVYKGTELVPRGSHVQARSLNDSSINLNIWVFNTQNGINIHYSDGSWSK